MTVDFSLILGVKSYNYLSKNRTDAFFGGTTWILCRKSILSGRIIMDNKDFPSSNLMQLNVQGSNLRSLIKLE